MTLDSKPRPRSEPSRLVDTVHSLCGAVCETIARGQDCGHPTSSIGWIRQRDGPILLRLPFLLARTTQVSTMVDEGKKMPLTRQQLPGAIDDFVKATARALRLGGEPTAAWPYSWEESEEPILDKQKQDSCNGPFWFREKRYREAYAPGTDYQGVYLFFDAEDTAIYVGKSEAAVGTRIWRHIGRVNKDGTTPHCEFGEDPEYVFVAYIPGGEGENGFIAPGLESYLLRNFKFKYNKQAPS